MKADTIDILNRLTSRELRDRLRRLQAEEKAVKVLLRATIAREQAESVRAAEAKGASDDS
jgi:hypothetical protein